MNIRKVVDYATMFTALDKLVAAALPQMKLYCAIGRLVSGRPEKGAAVAAAQYLSAAHPGAIGFSPRNLRRMREFYRTYESVPEVLAQTMSIGWTQNVIILEAELTVQERVWYIHAVRKFGWSKLELQRQIAANAHKENTLDFESETCYTEEKSDHADELGEASGAEGAAPVNSVVISDEGTGGPDYPSGHRRLTEYGTRCKGGPDRQLTCIGCDPFDLLIGEQGGAYHAQESWSQALHLPSAGVHHRQLRPGRDPGRHERRLGRHQRHHGTLPVPERRAQDR